jgi:cell wall-associated NlpC family hydrolase
MGFERITRIEDLQAGDIIFVNPHPVDGGPMHVFMLAEDEEGGHALRYDHGSDSRIMSKQPTYEPVSYENARFLFAYRPIVTEENNIYYNDLYAD